MLNISIYTSNQLFYHVKTVLKDDKDLCLILKITVITLSFSYMTSIKTVFYVIYMLYIYVVHIYIHIHVVHIWYKIYR